MQYIKNSKTTEAKNNLNAIGKGAISYFEAEHYLNNGLNAVTKTYPNGDADCGVKAGDGTIGQKVNPIKEVELEGGTKTTGVGNTADGQKIWKQLNFEIKSPIYYYYVYNGIGNELKKDSTTDHVKSSFQASATASLSDPTDSVFCLDGTVEGVLSAIYDDGASSCTANKAAASTKSAVSGE